MRNVILLICVFFFASVFTACTQAFGSHDKYDSPSSTFHIKGGKEEDDDQPIYIQVTRKKNGQAASGISISLINVSADTLTVFTDSVGRANFYNLPLGQYNLAIESPLYHNIYSMVTINAPQIIRTDTLVAE